jgi:hypothetical protein
MSFAFHPAAEEEFVEAIAYYEHCEPDYWKHRLAGGKTSG